MRILVPTADYPPIEGGISSVALHTSRELAAMGHEVTVVAPRFPGQTAFDEAEPVNVVRYGGYWLGWFRFLPMLLKTWPRVRRSDLVLAINVSSGGVIGLLGHWLHRTRYAAFAYAYEFLRFRRFSLAAWLLGRVYRRASVVIAISSFTRDKLIAFGVQPEQIEIVWPGATPRRKLPETAVESVRKKYTLDTPHVILAVGRFVSRKGHLTLVRAMPRILERFPNAVLVLVGRGPELSPTVREACKLGVRDQVVFPGYVSEEDLAALYQTCELFALPTGAGPRGQVEGFGLVFTEAYAYGKPVVAGRSGGVEDAVIDGETGLIVEPEDPAALAEAILSIMEDPEFANRLGEHGRIRVETELNWTRFTEGLLAAVESRRKPATRLGP